MNSLYPALFCYRNVPFPRDRGGGSCGNANANVFGKRVFKLIENGVNAALYPSTA
jgi:hypothetical protein